MVGLAVILALVFGVAATALGAAGDNFILGQKNVASNVSTLVRRGVGPGLSIQTDDGPPLKTNSRYRVTNLNADKVDGQEGPMWAIVNADGTLARSSSGVTGSSKRVAGVIGEYKVTFNRDVSTCAYSTSPGDRQLPAIEVAPFRQTGTVTAGPNEVFVNTRATKTEAQEDHSFHLVVFC